MTGMSAASASTETPTLANTNSRDRSVTEDLLLSPQASSPSPLPLVTTSEPNEQIDLGPFVTTRRGSGRRHHPYTRPQAPIRQEVPVNKSFTFVNVNDTSVVSRLQRDLTKLGIRGSNFKSFPMPTSADEHMFVTFTITDGSEKRRMERILENQNWQEKYSISSLMTSWPFFAIQHTPKSLLKAIVLATANHVKPSTMAEQLPSMLVDKSLMKRSLEDVAAIAKIKKSLSADGMTLLGEVSKEFITRRDSCRF
ncbi:unnamed protein product [Caenorhabditis brenneri]